MMNQNYDIYIHGAELFSNLLVSQPIKIIPCFHGYFNIGS
jgi:hypothetical protein